MELGPVQFFGMRTRPQGDVLARRADYDMSIAIGDHLDTQQTGVSVFIWTPSHCAEFKLMVHDCSVNARQDIPGKVLASKEDEVRDLFNQVCNTARKSRKRKK